MDLILNRVCLSHLRKPVLHDISCKLEGGQLIALLGTNGVGKSSLIRAIAGLSAYTGEICLGNKSIHQIKRSEYAKQVAYLAQRQAIYWDLSVEQVIYLGRLPHLPSLPSWKGYTAKDSQIVQQVMQETETYALAQRPITQLSGGEQARVLLARAMAVQAKVLLADEPITSLDPYHQLRMMELLQQYAAQGNLVLVVLHDFSLVANFCQQVLLLHQGYLLAQGPPNTVLNTHNLATVYRIQTTDKAYLANHYQRL
jgi:iron complex transport system ATP-binding protein